uniref:Wsv136 n=1 Tax=White spot syndrome virus TaxID=92652 RepID=A0A2U9G946_WSSV|nr:wsv136 [Shrimp white spot syndrome virus]AWQ61145.1 wsv136 [Shrimp white spot syndrome virus]
MSIYSPEMSAMMNENEEKNVLSNRRAVILIFFIGVVILSLLFLIRLDIDIKYGNVGERATIVKKTSPIFKELSRQPSTLTTKRFPTLKMEEKKVML